MLDTGDVCGACGGTVDDFGNCSCDNHRPSYIWNPTPTVSGVGNSAYIGLSPGDVCGACMSTVQPDGSCGCK